MAYVDGPAGRVAADGLRRAHRARRDRRRRDAPRVARAGHARRGLRARRRPPPPARQRERADLREHVAALYQVNPHYVAAVHARRPHRRGQPGLLRHDGHAARGRPRRPRGRPRRHLPARAALRPRPPQPRRGRGSICGIEYGLVGADDEARPVEVSLRAFRAGGKDAVVIQATDLAVRRRLERRVEAFTDTLDLMVDQRVAAAHGRPAVAAAHPRRRRRRRGVVRRRRRDAPVVRRRPRAHGPHRPGRPALRRRHGRPRPLGRRPRRLHGVVLEPRRRALPRPPHARRRRDGPHALAPRRRGTRSTPTCPARPTRARSSARPCPRPSRSR